VWFGPREQNLLIKGARVPCESDTRKATLGALRFGFNPLFRSRRGGGPGPPWRRAQPGGADSELL
jgi:hypothetical protein